MSLAIVTPAPLDAITALAFPSGRAPGRHLQAMILQSAKSETVAFARPEDGQIVMIAGFFPLEPLHAGERFFEFWLQITHPAVPHLPALRRLTRLTLARVAESGPVRVRALVAAGHRPGARLAAIVGMSRVGSEDGFECYEWSA